MTMGWDLSKRRRRQHHCHPTPTRKGTKLFVVSVSILLFIFERSVVSGYIEVHSNLTPRQSRSMVGSLNSNGGDDDSSSTPTSEQSLPPPLQFHHTAIKTRDIETAIKFYSLFGFEPTSKFRAGPAKAAWLETGQGGGGGSRIELIEVPAYILLEAEGTRKRAIDLIERQDILGQNHLALDVTPTTQNNNDDDKGTKKQFEDLSEWIDDLNERSLKKFGKTLRMAVEPRQQMIGNGVYELAFLYDADGALIELLWKQSELTQTLSSGWEPWDGKGFQN